VEIGPGLSIAVQVVERLGGVSIAYGTIGEGRRFCAALPGDAALREGEEITLSVNPRDVHVFDSSGQVLRRRMAPALVA
jgi:multiple sugar transport system ATP-binding protein